MFKFTAPLPAGKEPGTNPFPRRIRTSQPKPGRYKATKATSGPIMAKRLPNALGFVSISAVSVENDAKCSERRFDAGEAVCSGCAYYRQSSHQGSNQTNPRPPSEPQGPN